jgi:hypothetical protein
MPKSAPFVPRTLPPLPPEKTTSRAEREREAKAYWDSLTEAQEVWALRKMGYSRSGSGRRSRPIAPQRAVRAIGAEPVNFAVRSMTLAEFPLSVSVRLLAGAARTSY